MDLMNDVLIKEIEKKYLEEVVKPTFPFITYFEETSTRGQSNSKPQVAFHPSKSFVSFKGSEYYYSKADKFIHYTSLANAINIINDGFFRLNSLEYLDDPQELIFAGNEILDKNELAELEELKKSIFCISLCKYDQNTHPDNFDKWRLYGNNGLGVGIVFKFSSTINWWRGNYLSEIYYGKEETNNNEITKITEKFKKFRDNHIKFIKDNKAKVELMSNKFGRNGQIPDWIAIFLAFHKSSLYKIEDEIRFLRCDDESDNSFTLNYEFEKTLYGKLLLKTKNNLKQIENKTKNYRLPMKPNINDANWIREATKSDPIVEIEKIIIGYRHSSNFRKLQKSLTKGFCNKNGFPIEVELSALSEAFKKYHR